MTGEAQALNIVFVLRLTGGVPVERLKRALESLQHRHPLLGVRVVAAGRRYRFVDGAPVPPVRTVERGSAAAWRTVAEDELNRHLDLGIGPALRCVYLPPATAGGSCEIVLTAHHAVLDGASSVPLLTELVALCDGSASLDPPDRTVPPAADTLFPARYRGLRSYPGRLVFVLRQIADEIGYRLRRRGPPRPPLPEPARCRILTLALDEEATAALVRRSRSERVTLNGALTASLLLAAQRHLYGARAGPLRYFAFADLRPYLVPNPAVTTVAVYVSGLRFTISMPAGAAFWPVARRVSQQIGAAGRRGDKFHAARLMPTTMRVALRQRSVRMATVALSYAGVVRFASGTETPRVKGLHAFVSNLSCGPEFTASVKLFGNRLAWDIVYLEADMSEAAARKIGDEIVRTLTLAAEEGGEGS